MNSPRFACRIVCGLALGAGWLLAANPASAQQQDRIDHILNPDRTLHAEGFEKVFVPASAAGVEKKSFLTRLFGGSHAATPGGGDGTFHTTGFVSGRESFASTNFATRPLPQAGQSAALSDRAFGTKTMAVKEDLAATKTATVRGYVPSDKPFLGQGRRQDDIDDLRRQKNLTIDQVREILNKPK